MKKTILAATIFMTALAGLPTAAFAKLAPIDQSKLNLSLEVLVNARKVSFPDVKPMQMDNRVLVPLRFVSDKLGGKLSLIGKDITIVKGDRTIKLTIGAKSATANGKRIDLDVAANAVNGRTMVPLRFISEALGEKVDWDSVNQFVWIGSKNVPNIKDLVEAVDVKPYEKYYGGPAKKTLLTATDWSTITKVTILKPSDLPVEIGGDIYYRLDKAQDTSGNEYFRLSSTETGSLGHALHLLREGKTTYKRQEEPDLREEHDGIRIQYYRVVDVADYDLYRDKNYKNMKLKDVDFIGMYTSEHFSTLFKMDFLKK